MAMSSVREIETEIREPEAYRQFQAEEYERMERAAAALHGRRIVHVNSTAQGGGVAELLKSQVPLERGLGLDARWWVIEPEDTAFFDVTKKIHNLFQGAAGELSDGERQLYEAESGRLRQALEKKLVEAGKPDILIAHDPQPLLAASEDGQERRILRLHIDICAPNPWVVAWLCGKIGKYNHVVVSRADCAPTCLPFAATSAIAPAIDPLSAKNQLMEPDEAKAILGRHGVDTTRPVVAQVSRFDPWKDPVGVIEAYRLAKREVPGLQLLLVGFTQAADDPEAAAYLAQTRGVAGGDADVLVFSDLQQLQGLSNEEFVRAVQAGSVVIVQKSIREGFGLTATEAMWKGKAVIGGTAGGLQLQIQDGVNGRLAATNEETAQALIQLLQNAGLRERLGGAARESVREKFLLPRFVRENLEVYSTVLV